MTGRAGERGAALLTVLMLVAVISILAMAALERLKLSTHIAGNAAAMDQARSYALAGEQIAISRAALITDAGADRSFLAGGRAIPVPLDQGSAEAVLSDGGNCFNVNSLVNGFVETDNLTARPIAMAQFIALLDMLGIPPASATPLTNAITDWIDSDSVPLPGGAEDGDYQRGPSPHRAANTLVQNPEELRAVSGMTPELYARLRPFLCALPTNELSPIGVNTIAPDQAALVAMLVPGRIGLAQARAMIESRPAGGFADINRFWATPALAGTTPSPEVLAQPLLRPRWINLSLTIRIGNVELEEHALIDAGKQPAKLVQRRYGEVL